MGKALFIGSLLTFIFTIRPTAQVFNGTSGTILPGYSINDFPITVTGLNPATINNSFGLEEVCINISYPSVQYIGVYIVAPDGIATKLADRATQGGSDYPGTCFNMASANYLTLQGGSGGGTMKPHQSFGQVNNGQNGNGQWQLRVINYGFSVGTVNAAHIQFGAAPARNPIANLTSNLPLVLVTTTAPIKDEPKEAARMDIVYNGPGQQNQISDQPAFTSDIGIEIRGASSQSQPKLSYGFETRNTLGIEADTSFLGFPRESDWVLIGSYPDRTFMRNYMTYEMHRRMGHWAPRMRLCELFIDGVYQGIYTIGEAIRRSPNRVDIAKLTVNDNAGDELTGGYIWKRDGPTQGECGTGWYSTILGSAANPFGGGMYWLHQYPCAALTPQQQNYLSAYIDTFETALMGPNWLDPVTGYVPFVDQRSFVDYQILAEYCKSGDGYRKSVYFYKDKDSRDRRIVSGPMWDFDFAWGLDANICNMNNAVGWSYNDQSSWSCYPQEMPYWYLRLLQDPSYADSLYCRWTQLRGSFLSTSALHSFIDSTATLIGDAQARNFDCWPILFFEDYQQEMTRFKNWITTRGSWIDANLNGACAPVGSPSPAVNTPWYSIFPNPAKDQLAMRFQEASSGVQVTLSDVYGRTCDAQVWDVVPHATFSLQVQDLAAGVYFLRCADGGRMETKVVHIAH
jgi:hypothetical protein